MGKVGKRRNEFHPTQNEYAQTRSFNGNLQAESVPVHNTGYIVTTNWGEPERAPH